MTDHRGNRDRSGLCLLVALPLALAACAASPPSKRPMHEAARYVVVRHAEKETGPLSTPADPALTDAGRQRAMRLARSLEGESVVAVYTTPYLRTRDTALPTARAHGLVPVEYDPRQTAETFVDALRSAHPVGTVLVVGHSNTVPQIAAALCACEVAPMSEDEYEHRFIVDIDGEGRARLSYTPLP